MSFYHPSLFPVGGRQLASPIRLHPVNSRRYTIEKHDGQKWNLVAYAVSTHEADRILSRKAQFENGRFRATEVKSA